MGHAWSAISLTPLFTLSVVIASWYGGRVGVFASVALAAVLRELVIARSFDILGWDHAANIAVFVGVVGLVGSLTCHARHRMVELDAALREKRAAEEANAQTMSLLRAITDHTKDPMYVKDTAGRFVFANPAALRTLHTTNLGDVLGKTTAELASNADHGRAIAENDRRVIDQATTQVIEEVLAVGGMARVYQSTKSPWRGPNGQIIGLIGVSRDITERHAADLALRLSEERFRLLFDSSPLPKLLIDPGTLNVVDANTRAAEVLGYDRAELKRRSVAELLPSGDRVEVPRELLDGELEELRFETRARTREGRSRDVLVTARMVELGERRLVYAAVVDITEAKETQAELARAHAELEVRADELEARVRERTATLEASLASMEELLYTIAHDLRAPYRAAAGFAELLRVKYAPQLPAEALGYLERIEAAAIRNDELILDLVEYGRLAHTNVELDPVDLGSVVGEALAELGDEARRRGARVLVHGEDWPKVIGNGRLLKRILVNLVSNAIKYTPAERSPRVEIRALEHHGRGILEVRDNGSGIDENLAEHVFEPFIRLPNSQGTDGTGMGLAIVRKAAGVMRGAVGVESTPGQGSCFWVDLPLAA